MKTATPDPDIRQHAIYLRRVNARPATIEHRIAQLERLHKFLGVSLCETTSDALDRWQASLRVSASSVFTYTSHVRGFYRWAEHTGRTDTDLARDLPMPRIPKRSPRPIPERDLADALISSSFDHMLQTWYLLAGYSGLRAGEIAKICRTDVRPDSSGEGGWLTVHGKGGHERVVRLSPEVMRELAPYLHHTGPIFRNRNGHAYTAHTVSVRASQHLKGIGLDYTLHTLRHRFATRLCDLGADVRDVQAALGHQNLATTTGYLAHNARRSSSSVDTMGAGIAEMLRRTPPHNS